MRKGHYRILAVLLFAALPARADVYDKLAKRLVEGVDGLSKQKAAVLPFAYADGRASTGGRIVAEALATAIAERHEAVLVERSQIDSAMDEISLSATGAISSGTALQAGRLVGAKFLVLGSLSDEDDSEVLVNARLVETESGVVRAAGKATVRKTWRDVAPMEASTALTVASLQVPQPGGDDLLVETFGDRRVMVEYVNTENRPHLRLTDVTRPGGAQDDVELPFDPATNRFRKLEPTRAKLAGRRYLLWSGVWKPETGPVLHMAPLKGFWSDAIEGDREVLFDFVDLETRWTRQVSAKGYFLGERGGYNLVAFFERRPKARLRVSIWSLDADHNLSRSPAEHFVVAGRHGREASSAIIPVGTRHFRFRYDADADKVTVEEL